MAYRVIRRRDVYDSIGDREVEVVILCDSSADVTNLPTNVAPGSVAKVAGGSVYTLSPSGEWKEEGA